MTLIPPPPARLPARAFPPRRIGVFAIQRAQALITFSAESGFYARRSLMSNQTNHAVLTHDVGCRKTHSVLYGVGGGSVAAESEDEGGGGR